MPDETSEPELPRAVALAWGVAANPQRGPKRELSIEGIVDVAVRLADAGGLTAVSMAAVASELGFTPMSLYRYVTAKEDLLLLMQESGIGLPSERVREAEGWRAGLAQLADELLQAYVEHPWLLDIPITALPITPNHVAWFDAALEALAPTGSTAADRVSIVLAVTAQARWSGAIRRGSRTGTGSGSGPGVDGDGWSTALLDELVSAEEYPAMAAVLRDGVVVGGRDPVAFGLDRVLDGVDAYLAGRAAVLPGAVVPAAVVPAAVDPLADAASKDQKYREAVKARREVEKKLREARKREAELLKAARERLAR